MRYFIGLTFDEQTIKDILYVQRRIKKEFIKQKVHFKDVKKHNFHLTLKFIGDYEQENKLFSLIKNINTSLIPKESEIDKVDNFNGRVVFLNISHQKPFWILNEEITEKLRLHKDNFHAHITLFRLKERYDYNVPLSLKVRFKSLCLFNSTLTSRGPIYEVLYEKKIM